MQTFSLLWLTIVVCIYSIPVTSRYCGPDYHIQNTFKYKRPVTSAKHVHFVDIHRNLREAYDDNALDDINFNGDDDIIIVPISNDDDLYDLRVLKPNLRSLIHGGAGIGAGASIHGEAGMFGGASIPGIGVPGVGGYGVPGIGGYGVPGAYGRPGMPGVPGMYGVPGAYPGINAGGGVFGEVDISAGVGIGAGIGIGRDGESRADVRQGGNLGAGLAPDGGRFLRCSNPTVYRG